MGTADAAEQPPAVPAGLHAALLEALLTGACLAEFEHRAAEVQSRLGVQPELAGAAESVQVMRMGMQEHLLVRKFEVAPPPLLGGSGHSCACAACWCPAAQQAGCCVHGLLVCVDRGQSAVQDSLQW